MATVEIQGVGRVEIEGFDSMSPDQRVRAVEEIAGQEAQGGPHPQATGYGRGDEFGRQATELMGRVNKHVVGLSQDMSDVARAPARAFGNEAAQDVLGVGPTEIARRGGVSVAEGPPETNLEAAAEGVGIAATSLIPMGGVATGTAKASAGPIGRAFGSLFQPFVEKPLRMTATELGIGGLMGAGGQVGEERAEDIGVSPQTGRLIGETVGGLGAAGLSAPMRTADKTLSSFPGVSVIWRGIKRTAMPFTEAGSRQRAHDQIVRQSGRAGQDADALKEPNEFGLSPAQQTGNPRLMQMERTLRDLDPAFDSATREQIEESYNQIRRGVEDMTEGATAQDSARIIRGARQVMEGKINRLVSKAERQAGLRVAELGPNIPREQAAKIYREELDTAYAAADDLRKKLYAEVPNTLTAEPQTANETFRRFMENDDSYTLRHMPEVAREAFTPGGNRALGTEVSVKELDGLRSDLLEIGRNASSGSGSVPRNDKKARYAFALADALEKDIDSIGDDVSLPLTLARDHVRLMKKTFRQGTVGDILGLKRTGAPATAPETTLSPLDRTGLQAAVSADELRTATQGAERAENAAQEYLRNRFARYASGRDGFDAERGRRFMQENAELLERFPGLRSQISEAVEQGRFARQAREEADAGLKETRDTPAGRFSEETKFGREFETIRSPDEARSLLAQAKRLDDSGRAVAGLKAAARDYLIGPDLSVRAFRTKMQGPKGQIARELLDNAEMMRVNKIMETVNALETAERAGTSQQSLMSDAPARVMNLLAGVVGVATGRQLNTGTIQVPGKMGGFFTRTLDSLTTDKAEKLIQEAVRDGDIMRGLLLSPNLPAERAPRALRAWLAANTGMQFREDEEGEPRTDDRQSLSAPQRGEAQAAVQPRSGENVDPKVVRRFETLQARLGKSLPVKSGYRSPEKNKAVGGAEQSRHMEGDALDIDVSDLQPKERLKLIREASRLGFTGIGVYDSTIHLDMGDKRAWGPSHGRESVPHWAEATVRGHLKGSFAPQ